MPEQIIHAFGLHLTPEQWEKKTICKVSADELVRRLSRGMSPSEAITTAPVKDARRISRYRGVSWHRNIGKWVAQIKVDGKVEFLGSRDDDREAAELFDARARQLGRETNF